MPWKCLKRLVSLRQENKDAEKRRKNLKVQIALVRSSTSLDPDLQADLLSALRQRLAKIA